MFRLKIITKKSKLKRVLNPLTSFPGVQPDLDGFHLNISLIKNSVIYKDAKTLFKRMKLMFRPK